MRTRLLGVVVVGVAFALGATGCSSDDTCQTSIVTRATPGVDFDLYSTFAIQEIGAGAGGAGGAGGDAGRDIPDDVALNIEKANAEAAKQLTAGGLTQVDPAVEEPDLWIGSAANTKEQNGVYWECVPGWYWWGWYVYWDSCAWLQPIPVEYSTGTLVVALADSSTSQIVFGGVATGVLGCDDVDARVTSAVDQIFADYPFPTE
ncbi:MAG TPA: DUF4136 domain-containing protein [Polyangiaceae bacterium]|nr:DUF4136 domain-containing protein [Polyangiaceae bacterium]